MIFNMAYSPVEPRRVCGIATLNPEVENWKIKVSVTSTPEKSETHYVNKDLSGRRCVYELTDDSGRIDLVAFDEDAKRLESLKLKEVYLIWGATVTPVNKEFSLPEREYELKFNDRTTIKPAEGSHSLRAFETPSSDAATKDPKPTTFDPINLKNVTVGKPELPFDVLGILYKTSEAIEKRNSKSEKTFTAMRLNLIDATGIVEVSVIGNKIELKKLTELVGQVIGVVGCTWKTYPTVSFISSRLEKLYEEKELPDTMKEKVRELKKIEKKEITQRLQSFEDETLNEEMLMLGLIQSSPQNN